VHIIVVLYLVAQVPQLVGPKFRSQRGSRLVEYALLAALSLSSASPR